MNPPVAAPGDGPVPSRNGRLAVVARRARSAVRLARRFVHHRDDLVECGAPVAEHRRPAHGLDLPIEAVPPGSFASLVPCSPHLSGTDVERFVSVGAVALVVRDGDHVAAMNFFVPGPGHAWVDELDASVPVAEGEHFSCRTFVDPAYRGRAMFEHLVWVYASGLGPEERIWGLVMARNAASLRSLGRNGWVATARWTATTRLGRVAAKRRAHEPAPLR